MGIKIKVFFILPQLSYNIVFKCLLQDSNLEQDLFFEETLVSKDISTTELIFIKRRKIFFVPETAILSVTRITPRCANCSRKTKIFAMNFTMLILRGVHDNFNLPLRSYHNFSAHNPSHCSTCLAASMQKKHNKKDRRKKKWCFVEHSS